MRKNIFTTIKTLFATRRLNSMARKAIASNQDPRTFKVWEHNGWGDRISIRKVNADGTFLIDGHLMTKPVVGDFIIYDTSSGHKGKGVVSSTEYPGDPWDMFFANVIPLDFYEEK